MGRTGPTAAELAERRLGVVLRDRYRLEQVLGSGGMATVYLAVHRNGNRVALKLLRPELSVHDVHRERFVRESYAANSIDHPGAVRVLDDDVAEDGCPFLVMELLRGEPLEAYYRRSGRLPPREVLAIGHAVCDVLARAHARGVVHRDIKPDNIFLTTAGELKVLDFGIAQVRQDGRESGTRTGHMLGTPAYMPPEQALGRRHEIDGRSDLWALGATMFALLAGRAVHQSDTPEEIVVKAAMLPAPSLALLCPDAPPAIVAVVDRALAFASRDRFADAAAMQAAIDAAHLDTFGEPITATQLPRGLGPSHTWTPREHDAIATFAAETLASDPGRAQTSVGESSSLSDAGEPSLPPEEPAAPALTIAAPAPPPPPPALPPPRTAPARWLGVLAAVTLAGAASLAALPKPDQPDATACTSNAACTAAAGRPAICRKDQARCVALETDRCRLLAEPGDVDSDDTLWIGAMYSTSDGSSNYGVEAGRCVDLARRDFAGLTGGLPPARPGGRARPIGVILCDDTRDHERSAAHLVDDVGVPAILGFGRSKQVLELAGEHFVPKGVLALASNTADMLASIPHPPGEPRLVYRVTTSAGMTAPPTITYVRAAIERELRAGPLGPDGTLKIAIVRSSNASGTSHTDALFTALAATRPAGPGREEVRTFVVEDSITGDAAVYVEPAAAVAAFAPHLVLDGGAPAGMLAQIERAWTTDPRPRYVHGGLDAAVMQQIVAARPDFAGRLRSIGTRSNTTFDKVRAHYHATFGADVPDLSPTPYDAFYVLAYAAIALGDQPVTGRALARAIRRLGPAGEPIEVGPAGIYPALKVLAAGGTIDLRGTLTTLDFDPETGDATAEFAVFCPARDGSRLVETATHVDATGRTLIGDGRCP